MVPSAAGARPRIEPIGARRRCIDRDGNAGSIERQSSIRHDRTVGADVDDRIRRGCIVGDDKSAFAGPASRRSARQMHRRAAARRNTMR
jgi:hypothetical protein